MNRTFLPLAVDIRGKTILVAGAGEAAAHKMKALLLYGAKILVVAPEIVKESVREAAAEVRLRRYETSDLDGIFLAYAATSEHETNMRIAREAGERGILCNVCDLPAESTFVSPAIHKVGHVSIAVSTNGQEIRRSLAIRKKIIEVFGDGPLPG